MNYTHQLWPRYLHDVISGLHINLNNWKWYAIESNWQWNIIMKSRLPFKNPTKWTSLSIAFLLTLMLELCYSNENVLSHLSSHLTNPAFPGPIIVLPHFQRTISPYYHSYSHSSPPSDSPSKNSPFFGSVSWPFVSVLSKLIALTAFICYHKTTNINVKIRSSL